jgi:hypothetical protein
VRVFTALVAVSMVACYRYVPLAPAPQPGTRTALVLSDQGRVGMAPSIGSGVERVEGTLLTASDSDYLLSVSGLVGINGARSPWAGETVRVQRGYVANALERRLAKGQSVAVAVGAGAAVAIFIATRNLLGFGSSSPGSGGGGPGNGQ